MRAGRLKSPAGAAVSAVLLVLMSLAALDREREASAADVPPPPPEPVPFEVDVPRGAPVWIPLRAYSLSSPIIRYRIWRKARAGRVGAPQMVSPDTAAVKYTPPAGYGPGEDSFEYQVQSDSGISAPAEVQIKITDKDPVLVAPAELDFGQVLAGGSSRQTLVLQNIGGGLAQGAVQVPDGWSVEGNQEYAIAGGAKESFTIVFQPAAQREYTGDIAYTGDPERATDLVGVEVAPIAVTSGTVELEPAGTMRTGTIQVENRTDSPVALQVSAGPDLEAGSSLNVPANGTAQIEVRAKAEPGREINSGVTIEGAGQKLGVAIHAAASVTIARTPQSMPVAAAARPLAATGPAAAAPAGPAGAAESGPAEVNLPPMDEGTGPAPERGFPVAPIAIQGVGENGAELVCLFNPGSGARTYRVEAGGVGFDAQHRPEAVWQPFSRSAVTVNGSKVSVALDGLQAGSLYLLRVVGLDEKNRIVAVSSTASVWTPHPAKRSYWGWAALGVAALAAAGAWRWWKRPRAARAW